MAQGSASKYQTKLKVLCFLPARICSRADVVAFRPAEILFPPSLQEPLALLRSANSRHVVARRRRPSELVMLPAGYRLWCVGASDWLTKRVYQARSMRSTPQI